MPWLPDRLLDHTLPTATVLHVLDRAIRGADRFEHLVRPRLLRLTESAGINRFNGFVLVVAVLLLMAPLPLVPLANTLPGIAIILLCLGMAERDGGVVLLGHLATLVSTVYVAAVFWLATRTGRNFGEAWQMLTATFERWF